MIGRIIWSVVALLVVAALVYTGIWHAVTLFVWQNPMLTWVPLLVMIVVGYGVGAVGMLASNAPAPRADDEPERRARRERRPRRAAAASRAGARPSASAGASSPGSWCSSSASSSR